MTTFNQQEWLIEAKIFYRNKSASTVTRWIPFQSEDPVDATALDETHGSELVQRFHQTLVNDQVFGARNFPQQDPKVLWGELRQGAHVDLWAHHLDDSSHSTFISFSGHNLKTEQTEVRSTNSQNSHHSSEKDRPKASCYNSKLLRDVSLKLNKQSLNGFSSSFQSCRFKKAKDEKLCQNFYGMEPR